MTFGEDSTQTKSSSSVNATPSANLKYAKARSAIHPAVDAPLCSECVGNGFHFFDPSCTGCRDILVNPHTPIGEIFAVLRQWTPQTQQNLDIVIQQVLDHGAGINDRDGLTDMTLLQYVAKSGAQGMGDAEEAARLTKILIEYGADMYMRCRWTNMAALHYAVFFDVAPVVRTLLKATSAIDIDSTCAEFDQGTALHVAASNLARHSTEVLLQYGANPNIKNSQGQLPADCLPGDLQEGGPQWETAETIRTLLANPKPLLKPRPESGKKRLSSAASSALTALGLRMNDRVMVGGIKAGWLRFCGHSKFGPGLWAGIELEDAVGKNDGSVAGQRYFTCAPRHGIFAPLSKIGPYRVKSASPPKPINHGRVDVSRITSKIDSGLRRSSSHMSATTPPPEEQLSVGDRVVVAGQRKGVIRYAGQTEFAPGFWYGIELDSASGRNDGSVNNRRYFACRPRHGVFAPPARVQRISDISASRESLNSSYSDKHRRMSEAKASASSIPSLSKQRLSLTALKPRTYLSRTARDLPKSSGVIGQRSISSRTKYLREGMTVEYESEQAVVRYIGAVDFAPSVWLGIELKSAGSGNQEPDRHDGSVNGRRYFSCRPGYGVLVQPSTVTVQGVSAETMLSPRQQLEAEPSDSV